MNWDAIGAIGDFVGGVGVIVTLVYLAVQIRTNTSVLRSQAQREMSSNITSRFFESKEILSAAVKIKNKDGFDTFSQALMNEYDLTASEAESYWRYQMQIWAGLQADFKMGVVDEQAIALLLSTNDNKLFWETAKPLFDPVFTERVQRIESRSSR